jgi:ferredoxin-NADP reductase
VRSFRLTPVDGEPIAPFRAGQFLAVRLSDSEAGDALTRTWTLSDYQDSPDSYRLTIKRVGPGGGSDWMHAFATPGRRLLARAPVGRFSLDRSGFVRTVLISAGIGVTPMLAMLKAHALRGDNAPPLLWVHAAKRGETAVHGSEINALLREHGLERRVFYSDPGPDDGLGVDYDEVGRLSPARLQALIAPAYVVAPFGRTMEIEGKHSDFYICGPAAFETFVRETLIDLGAPEGRIFTESFGVATGPRSVPHIERADVEFDQAKLRVEWTAHEDMTLLELAEAHGLKPNCACRLGLCGACDAGLVDGDVSYDPQPSVTPLPGRVLMCCARPASARVVLGL